ncbi:MAG TPA: hypothetical protein VG389_26965 [Myxococcota bacterium]|jgi:uncharacterized repeat protein (TIGR01451 family)|nr:hypothetical protein [Myxococcota bacterium]
MKRAHLVRIPLALGVVLAAGNALADSVAQLQIYKRLTAETIALIDPQGGTSMGGASTDVMYAVGDVLTFRIAFTPVPNGATRGLGGYITEYVPGNTEVVGARIVDGTGNTLPPHRGGLAAIGWGPRGAEGYAPPLEEGGISSLYADTGVFFSTDPRTARIPDDDFLSVANGVLMSPDPTGAAMFDQLLGITGGHYAHNDWDWIQVQAFGVGGGFLTNGTGNTPFGYGSAVAGPDTFYQFEATETAPGVIEAASVVGPWERIRAPGAEVGTGVPATVAGPIADRLGVPTDVGYDLSADNPLPPGTNAVRFAVGELVVGDEYFAEISLRVLAAPLDPVMGDDVNCTEVFGGDASARRVDATDGGKDNTWRYFVPSPSCVKLDLRFELDVNTVMALSGDTLTYTITTHNLSLLPQTNVVVTQDLSTTGALMFVSATGAPAIAGDVLTWPAITLMPGDLVVNTVMANVTGGGDSTTSTATYTSDQVPAPGFTVQTLTNIQPLANLDLAMSAAPAATTAGSTVTYTATIFNSGTGTADSAGCATPGCFVGVTLPMGFTYVAGTATMNGATVGDPVLASGQLRFLTGLPDVLAGATLTVTFDVLIDAAQAPGAYTATLETWFHDTGAGRNIEDQIANVAEVLVDVTRSAAPVVTGPVLAGATMVCGTTSEPDGTIITVYVDLLPVGMATAMGGTWCATVPTLYAGQDVSATAEDAAAGELESDPSAPPVVVTGVGGGGAACADGVDNDGDGLVDLTDPGCASPTDVDETDTPQCSDGLDNDGDGAIDFPADTGCSSFVDPVEDASPACGDGVDNDGDGAIDFPADLGCTDAADPSEADLPECSDGVDNDGDGAIDFPADGDCTSALDGTENPVAGGSDGGTAVTDAGGGVSDSGVAGDSGAGADGGGGGGSDAGGGGNGSGCGCKCSVAARDGGAPGSSGGTPAGVAGLSLAGLAFAGLLRRRLRPPARRA